LAEIAESGAESVFREITESVFKKITESVVKEITESVSSEIRFGAKDSRTHFESEAGRSREKAPKTSTQN
jgi:hypothetical protein